MSVPIPASGTGAGNADVVVLDSSGMLYGGILAYFTEQCKEAKDRRKIEARHRTGLCRKSDAGTSMEGDKKIEQIRYLLENGMTDEQNRRIVRSREQRMIHETYIRTAIPKIFQNEWEDNQERIMLKYGIEKLQQETFVVMPRRSGKTWSMAMFCAVMLVVCGDIETSIFATGQRTAGKLLKLIDKMLTKLLAFVGGDSYKVLQRNQEGIVLIGPDGTERKCGCYPGSAAVSHNEKSKKNRESRPSALCLSVRRRRLAPKAEQESPR